MMLPEDPTLFDDDALALAEQHGSESPYARVALDESPYAMHRRATLEYGFRYAGESATRLRSGLQHDRWGQHVGAFAELLALGLFARQGFDVQSEPELGAQSPDLQIDLDGDSTLVEVRAITGCGQSPWETPAIAPLAQAPLRAGLSKAAVAKELRQRARRRAALETEAERGAAQDLEQTLVRVLEKKAAAYRDLCNEWELPYLIALYEDADDKLSRLVRDWAFGPAGSEQDPEGGWHTVHDPHEGVFHGDRYHFAHVSGVLVFGREDEDCGQLLLRGDLIVNPVALRPLPEAWSFPLLRRYRLRAQDTPPRMRWTPYDAPPFALVPAG